MFFNINYFKSHKNFISSVHFLNMEAKNDLHSVFAKYCGAKAEMDGKTFAKMAKDTKLLDKKLTGTDVDLIFAKIKDKSQRTITFEEFKKGVEHCATKKAITFDECCNLILSVAGPQFKGTKADYVKFHDDKTLYTGVHQNGGPSTVDNKITDLSQLADRSGADVRGVKK